MAHVVAAALPEVTKDEALFRRIVGDLYRFGLITRDSMGGTQTGGDSLLTRVTTQLGRGLLQFIKEPN
jgi:inactivated superfamily I helicase